MIKGNYSYPFKTSEFDWIYSSLGYKLEGKDYQEFSAANIQVLNSIVDLLKKHFNFHFNFTSEDKSHLMGGQLANIFMPNNINNYTINNFIDHFKNHNLSISDQHNWLRYKNAFSHVFASQNLDAVEILLNTTSVKITETALIEAAIIDKKYVIEWVLNQQLELDLNMLSYEGKTAFNLAYDPEVIKILFEAGVIAYDQANYQDFCPNVNYRNSPELENLLNAIRSLVMSYSEAYSDISQEDHLTITATLASAELIVRFVEILADPDSLTPEIVELIEPYNQYWNNFISPELEQYFAEYNTQAQCLQIIDPLSLYTQIYD